VEAVMKTDAMTALREVVQNLGRGGDEITHPMIYAALGVPREDTAERDRIRRRCNMMVQSGELKRIKPGHYTYNPRAATARDHDKLIAMWRAIKSAKPGFTAQEITRVSGAEYSYAIKYLKHLEAEGYIKRHGRDGNTLLYRATAKTRGQSKTPHPPRAIKDPFAEERRQLHEMVGLFLLRDPYQPAVRDKIVAACRTILARFEKEEANDAG
jgi:predicted transcriptional regulator